MDCECKNDWRHTDCERKFQHASCWLLFQVLFLVATPSKTQQTDVTQCRSSRHLDILCQCHDDVILQVIIRWLFVQTPLTTDLSAILQY